MLPRIHNEEAPFAAAKNDAANSVSEKYALDTVSSPRLQTASQISKVVKQIPRENETTNTVMTAIEASGAKVGSGQREKSVIKPSIVLVSPTFTGAAYDHSFYKFFMLYDSTPRSNVTTRLNLLTSRVTPSVAAASAYTMLDLARKLRQQIHGANVTILSDPDIDRGTIFARNGSNAYGIVVLGHQEYVTQKEYDNLKRFVSNGGTMILLDGNVFYAQVRYDNASQAITLVKGHGWAYNGKSAWKSIDERWANETRQWVGSNYLCYQCKIIFENNPFGYKHHEEQYITNTNDVILYKYKTNDSKHIIAIYELNYMKGKVIGLGIFADDVEHNAAFDKYLLALIARFALG